MKQKQVIISLMLIVLMIGVVSAADVAYIVKNVNAADNVLTGALTEGGYSYEVIDDSQISSTNFSQYKIYHSY